MELPVFNKEQAGCTYYYSPLGVYTLGVVNQAHEVRNKDGSIEFKDHMHAHVYHEGIAKKGANNVASLIIKTLIQQNIIQEGCIGGELTIVFDNCTGQNKNNTVLKLLVYLAEMGYFKKVNFIFLIVGHTKNSADMLFNALKMKYHREDIHTMAQMIEILDNSDSVTVHPSEEADFYDWETFLDLFYSDYKNKIKQNHIFSATHKESWDGNQLLVDLRESDLPEHGIVKHKSIKSGFHGRSSYPKGAKGLKQAVENRKEDIKNAKGELLKQIKAPGINIYKQVELYYKYRPIVPQEHWGDVLYQKPDDDVLEAVRKEKASRKHFREGLNREKQKVADKKKEQFKEKMSDVAYGDGLTNV